MKIKIDGNEKEVMLIGRWKSGNIEIANVEDCDNPSEPYVILYNGPENGWTTFYPVE